MNPPDTNTAPCPSSGCGCDSPSNEVTLDTKKQPQKTELRDTQASGDTRGVLIDRVGVKDVQFPFQLKMKDGSQQATVGMFNLYVELPREERGTHMSRFVELLHHSAQTIDPCNLIGLCKELQKRLDAPAAHIEVACPFFLEKTAPASGIKSLLDYQLVLSATSATGKADQVRLKVTAAAKSLCPCSKEISDYGAHNQRSEISAEVECTSAVYPEELVAMAEQSASSPIYSLLKRPDEKIITEQAYDNPKFVEDIIRDLALLLNEEERVTWYRLGVENFESIHNHQAFAQIECTK